MTLRGLFGMVQGLAGFDRASTRGALWSVAASAGRLLSSWPDNFFSLLRQLLPINRNRRGTVLMRRHIEGVHRVVLQHVTAAADIAFLRETLVAFAGRMEEDLALESSPMSDQPNYAPAQPVPPPHGSEVPTSKAKATRRTSIYRKRPTPAPAGQRTFGQRAAARRIGLPVRVLRSLRQSGHFEVRHTASRVVAYHEADIIAFETKVATLHAQPRTPRKGGMSIANAMNLKLKFDDGKGELVAAVLDGKLSVIGSQGPGIRGLLIDKSEVEAFIAQSRAKAFGDCMTPAEVAKALHCDPLIVPTLIAAGHIEGNRFDAGLRISRESVTRFGAEYCSLAALAKKQKTSSRSLLPRLSAVGVKILSIARPNSQSLQPFIRIETDGSQVGALGT